MPGTPGENTEIGVELLSASGNTIGGTDSSDGNVITANQGDGLLIEGTIGSDASGNVVENNQIKAEDPGSPGSGQRGLGCGPSVCVQ